MKNTTLISLLFCVSLITFVSCESQSEKKEKYKQSLISLISSEIDSLAWISIDTIHGKGAYTFQDSTISGPIRIRYAFHNTGSAGFSLMAL